MNSASNLWASYRNKVYDTELSNHQERECSRAFYAGMYAAFKQMAEIADSVSDEELAAERVEEFRQAILECAEATL